MGNQVNMHNAVAAIALFIGLAIMVACALARPDDSCK